MYVLFACAKIPWLAWLFFLWNVVLACISICTTTWTIYHLHCKQQQNKSNQQKNYKLKCSNNIAMTMMCISSLTTCAAGIIRYSCSFDENGKDHETDINRIYIIIISVSGLVYFVGYQAAYFVFSQKLIGIFSNSAYAINKSIKRLIYAFPIIFLLLLSTCQIVYSLSQKVGYIHVALMLAVYIGSISFLLCLFITKLSQVAKKMTKDIFVVKYSRTNQMRSNTNGQTPQMDAVTSNSENNSNNLNNGNNGNIGDNLSLKQKELITIMTRTTILVTVALVSTLITTFSVLAIIITAVKNANMVALAHALISLDTSINILCLACHFKFSNQIYKRLCFRLDINIKYFCAKKVSTQSQISTTSH